MVAAWAPHLTGVTGFHPNDLVAERNLAASWVARWEAEPTWPVLYDDDGGWLTAEELEHRTRTMAGRLTRVGLVAGDRLVLSGPTTRKLVIAYIAAIRLGLVVVPVNASYREREVAHIVADAAPVAALVESPHLTAWIRRATRDEMPVLDLDVAGPDGPPGQLDAVRTDAPALLVYTSGTTGTPKGVPLSHANLLSSASAVRIAWRWEPDDRLALALPLFHLHGLGVGINGTLCAGASVVLRPHFAEGDVLDAILDHDATLFFGVPTMYRRLAESRRAGEFARLRLCVSGSAPLPADLFAAVEEASGQAVLERYGMSETVMNVSNPYDGVRRPGTVGFPLPGVEVRLSEGTDEIEVRGPNVFAGYLGHDEATVAAFTRDAWFRTGDVGRFDGDGYLEIIGRCKDLIISGGYNVYPREVEDVFRIHPAVADIAVVGVPDSYWGEQVTAFVVGDGSAEDTLRAWASESLAPYKQPKVFVFVEELPRNALGKVVAAELQAIASRGGSS
jgi:malonyl-CoA/methylmalonyl-CoA synthetase